MIWIPPSDKWGCHPFKNTILFSLDPGMQYIMNNLQHLNFQNIISDFQNRTQSKKVGGPRFLLLLK